MNITRTTVSISLVISTVIIPIAVSSLNTISRTIFITCITTIMLNKSISIRAYARIYIRRIDIRTVGIPLLVARSNDRGSTIAPLN